jgi:hypothetical protein
MEDKMTDFKVDQLERDAFGRVIPPAPKFAKAGENANPHEYSGVPKTVPTPSTVYPDGTARYATDGCTQDWNAIYKSKPKPETEKR